jgi:hypothetical protein
MYSQSNWFYNQGRLNLHEEMYSYVFKCIFAIFSKFITESHWFYVENISSMSLYSIPFCHLLFKYFLLPLFILFLFFLRNHYREPVMSQWLYQQPTLDSSLLLRGWHVSWWWLEDEQEALPFNDNSSILPVSSGYPFLT